MVPQYEELLLKRRHPDYGPLSLDWNHKLLPCSASMCVYACTGNRSQAAADMSGTQDGVLFSISFKWCQCNHDRQKPILFHLCPPPPSTLLLLFFYCCSVCSTHAPPSFSLPFSLTCLQSVLGKLLKTSRSENKQ